MNYFLSVLKDLYGQAHGLLWTRTKIQVDISWIHYIIDYQIYLPVPFPDGSLCTPSGEFNVSLGAGSEG